MKFIKTALTFLFVGLVFISCSSTSETANSASNSASSIYPNWYNTAQFSQDSTSFHGYATAIASDSLQAIARAEQQARTNLGVNVGDITESIRDDMVESGSSAAGNTDFIIILRTAHTYVEGAASLKDVNVSFSEGSYRAFASVSITKEELVETLEDGFTGHPRYWGEFSNSEGFTLNFR